jgi:hypothetical protein
MFVILLVATDPKSGAAILDIIDTALQNTCPELNANLPNS